MDDIRYQAFISYALDNNLPSRLPGPDGSCRGWVQVFHDELNRELVGVLSRRLRRDRRDQLLWIDYEQMRGGERLSPEIAAALGASRLLVPILSPAWFDSHWCLQELEQFLTAHADADTRVFPIWHSAVALDDLTEPRARAAHAQLREIHGIDFWAPDDEHQPRTLWDPVPDATEKLYPRRLQDLARKMAERIATIAAAEGEDVLPPGDVLEHPPADSPATTDATPRPDAPPLPGRHLVLINGGIADAAAILDLSERLRQRQPDLGIAVPLHTQPALIKGRKVSTLRRDLRTKLQRCTAVLFLYHQGPPEQLDEQIDTCTQAAAEPRDDGTALTLDLCRCGDAPLTFVPPELKVHATNDHADCCERFIALLRERVGQ